MPGLYKISIHSSHTGRDRGGSAGGGGLPISIHSSHTGRDRRGGCGHGGEKYFNPLFPYGERQDQGLCRPPRRDFNPLFPYGERRPAALSDHPTRSISIHSSHTGRDPKTGPCRPKNERFQSTLPIRGETANAYNLSARKVVASVQHSLIFDSSLLFPAVQNWFLG